MHEKAVRANLGRVKALVRNRWLVPVLALASTAGAFLVAAAAGVILGLAWFLVLAARYDNHTGSCFMIALLVVIVVAVLTFLIALAALPR